MVSGMVMGMVTTLLRGSINYTETFWGIVLGVAIRRFLKKFDADELVKDNSDVFLVCPLSVVFVLYVFNKSCTF